MPSKIKVLPDHIVNKIAAGEVIERPASVLKELIENSLDAGAKNIFVEIAGDGTKLIKVKDDGSGMTPEDALLCLERHATSKISGFDDLESLRSFGFRGEALPSISSVSHFDLLTKPKGVLGSAVRVVVEGHKPPQKSETSGPDGTTIEVRHLFFNTPARLKFLKSRSTEISHLMQVVTLYSLASPEVSFEVHLDGKTSLKLVPAKNKKDRLAQVFGKSFCDQLVEVVPQPDLRSDAGMPAINGYIGEPALTRPNRNTQYFFVNNRPIESRVLSHALYSGYRTLLMSGRYPVGILFLELDPAYFDVNVHPAKKEVRFKDESAIYRELSTLIQKSLAKANYIPTIPSDSPSSSQAFYGSLRSSQKYPKAIRTALTDNSHLALNEPVALYKTSGTGSTSEPESPAQQGRPSQTGLVVQQFTRVFGQLHATYILAENSEGLWVIDQHAAHERVLYEQVLSKYSQKGLASQNLLLPITLDLTPSQKSIAAGNQEVLAKLGFELSMLGGQTCSLQAVPSMLQQKNLKELFITLLENILEKPRPPQTSEFLDRMLYYMACRSAVMAGDNLTTEQIYGLLEALVKTQHPFACSHGRPTMVKITVPEIEKWFKRT